MVNKMSGMSSVFLVIFSVGVLAQSHRIDLEKLRGLESINVVVVDSEEDLTRDLTTAIELELRKKGITIDENSSSTFYVDIARGTRGTRGNTRLWEGTTYVALHEWVLLERDPSMRISTSTWERGYKDRAGSTSREETIIYPDKREYLRGMREEVLTKVQAFCNAYLRANPISR